MIRCHPSTIDGMDQLEMGIYIIVGRLVLRAGLPLYLSLYECIYIFSDVQLVGHKMASAFCAQEMLQDVTTT